MKDITEEDWNNYDWINISLFGEPPPRTFIRGARKTTPPDDGFHYEDVTTFSDKEQKWARIKEAEKG